MPYYPGLMRHFLSTFIALAFLFNGVAYAKRGGVSDGGGGSGVACFVDKQDANRAAQAHANQQPIPRNLIQKLISLEVTDYWEASPKIFVDPLPGENPNSYLQRVLKIYLDPVAPSFYTKIIAAINKVSLASSTVSDETGILAQVDDTGPVAGEMDAPFYHCALVQIVVRYASTQDNGQIHATLAMDKELFAKLGLENSVLSARTQIINQAMLQLHEALYLLGYGLGQENSAQVRQLTRNILSPSLFQLFQNNTDQLVQTSNNFAIKPSNNSALQLVSFLFNSGFAQWPFVDTGKASAQKAELMDAYVRLEKAINLACNQIPNEQPETCNMALWQTAPSFDTAESFMLMTMLALSNNQIRDFYAILDPETNSANDTNTICEFTNHLRDGYIKMETRSGLDSDLLHLQNIFDQAKNYCEKINSNSTSDTGDDE